jgi:hypothetical protein
MTMINIQLYLDRYYRFVKIFGLPRALWVKKEVHMNRNDNE